MRIQLYAYMQEVCPLVAGAYLIVCYYANQLHTLHKSNQTHSSADVAQSAKTAERPRTVITAGIFLDDTERQRQEANSKQCSGLTEEAAL